MHAFHRKLGLIFALFIVAFAGGCTGFFVSPTLSSIAIGPTNQTITVAPKQTLQMSATGTFSDGSTQDLTGKVSWSSSDSSCATISSSGLVSPVSSVAGICNADISAAQGAVNSSTATITVTEGTPVSITITASPTNPPANSTVTFDAKAIFSNSGAAQDITSSVTWNNSDPTDLTLTNGSGTGTISASPTQSTINVSASFANVTSNTVTLTIQ